MTGNRRLHTLPALLKSPATRRFFIAHFQSELGNGAAYVALVLVAYHRLHSGSAIALVLLADFLPGIVFAAPFGALADRFSRRSLAVGADLLRAGAFTALAVVPSFAATVVLALLAGVGTALFRPAVSASLSGLVKDEQRSPAIALYGTGVSLGLALGPALTALVFLFGSATLMLAVNGVTFLVSAALLRTVPLGSSQSAERGTESGRQRESLWSSTARGARSAAQTPGVLDLRHRLLVGLVFQGSGMIGSAWARSLAWALASFAVTGVGNALAVGPEIRLIQELVAERLLGRVFGLRDMLTNIAYVLAFVSAGAVLAAVGVRAVFALGGASLLMLALAGLLGFRPDRSGDPVSAVPEPASAA